MKIMKLKAILLKLMHPYEVAERLLRALSPAIKNDELYLKIRYFLCTHQKLHLDSPLTFSEKIQWLKLYNRNPEFTKMVDKFEAKEFIKELNIPNLKIIPTLGVWNKFEDIDFEKLPNQFVLKCTHDSGGLVICKDKSTFNLKTARKKINHSLQRNYYQWTREWPYKDVIPRIIAELYMEEPDNPELKDYKFFCFNGMAKYCQVIADRHSDETIDFYDRDWKHQPFIGLRPTAHHALTAHHVPTKYKQMLNIADALATRICSPFVRIDLYNINEIIYFGEITFFPFGGHGTFKPHEWNKKLGNLIAISDNG